ncbi:DUF362 domain-containing protein [Sutterella sp.]|uniref:DUF362 domain-containing protein n=1 Tax=Sutterella sp. TaxID=1981025 RepID=UPI0026DFCC9B|nr:DUF362 domain-containing protein [Sutterella sp.]MDO5531504.1 DUF362 domain-containing protein [Sutterella sp.]
MMQRRDFLIRSAIAGAAIQTVSNILPARAAEASVLTRVGTTELTHATADPAAPAVYFSPEITPEKLSALYDLLGRPATGGVGVKIALESPGGPHLDPALIGPLVQRLNGTFLDTLGYSSSAANPAARLEVAEAHGFTKVAPVDIIDAEGDMDLPLTGGHRLTRAITGKHFANYDSLVSIVRFKAHHLPRYGGTMKNLSICMGSLAGKALIHSAGRITSHYTSTPAQETAEAMADAVKAAMDARPGRWVFLQVLDAFEPDCGCAGTKNLGNIGLLASTDPVAIDRAAADITYGAAASDSERSEWERIHSVFLLDLAEKIGVGSTRYRLISA